MQWKLNRGLSPLTKEKNMKKSNLVKVKVGAFALISGITFALPAYAEKPVMMGEAGMSDASEYSVPQMSGLMSDMSSEMKDMSGMMDKDTAMNPEMQKKMAQMSKQMEQMRGDMPLAQIKK